MAATRRRRPPNLLPEWPAAGARRGLLHQRRPHRHHERREHFG